jgi:aspartate ammonia-lyase
MTLRDTCITGITANKDVCRAYVDNSIGIVTYLNPVIGHHNGDVVGREAAATGRSVRDLVLEKGLIEEADLDRILSVDNLMHPEYRGKRYVAGESRLTELGLDVDAGRDSGAAGASKHDADHHVDLGGDQGSVDTATDISAESPERGPLG